MLKRINKFQKTVTGGAIIIALFSILSRIIGLLRDRLLSSSFGAGKVLDAYYAAFRLPDLVFNTLVLGALSAAFIPVFVRYWRENKEEAWRITNGIMNILFLIVFIFSIILFFLAPFLVNYLVPGFDQETKILTVSLTRIMLLGTLFFTLSNVAGSVLNSFQRFVAYSLAPIMYNAGIIFGIVFLVKKMGYVGLGWGVSLGALLHFLIQVPALRETGYRWRLSFPFFHSGIKEISILMLPRCFGLAISQFNFIITTLIASGISIGAIAIYNLAFNLINFPVSIFGISLAISIFPLLSQCFAENNKEAFVNHFSRAIGRIFYLVIPTTVLFLTLRAQIVRLILGAGAFDWQDTILTSQTLGWFALSLFSQSLIPIFARAFYAAHNTKTPVKIALFAFIINALGCLIFSRIMGVGGLALAFSLASIINFIWLYFALNKKVAPLPTQEIIKSILRISGLSFIMAIIVQVMKIFVGSIVNMQTFVGVFLQTISAAGSGLIFYFIVSLFLKFVEVKILLEILNKKLIWLKNRWDLKKF